MPNPPRSPKAFATAALLFLFSTRVWAAESPCASGNQALSCRLRGVLSLLSATAVVLGVLLALALIAAVWYYRRNRNKDLLPR